MITVNKVTHKGDRHCNSCTAHRKPHYDNLTFYSISYGTDKQMQTRFTLCDECASNLAVQIYGFEYDTNAGESE